MVAVPSGTSQATKSSDVNGSATQKPKELNKNIKSLRGN